MNKDKITELSESIVKKVGEMNVVLVEAELRQFFRKMFGELAVEPSGSPLACVKARAEVERTGPELHKRKTRENGVEKKAEPDEVKFPNDRVYSRKAMKKAIASLRHKRKTREEMDVGEDAIPLKKRKRKHRSRSENGGDPVPKDGLTNPLRIVNLLEQGPKTSVEICCALKMTANSLTTTMTKAREAAHPKVIHCDPGRKGKPSVYALRDKP